jgi:hypothetical protein
MTKSQVELLCRIRSGLGPFHGARGRAAGAVVRNLERLRRKGFLRHRGRSRTYLLSKAGRALMGDR